VLDMEHVPYAPHMEHKHAVLLIQIMSAA
jgi:hypothetical protein